MSPSPIDIWSPPREKKSDIYLEKENNDYFRAVNILSSRWAGDAYPPIPSQVIWAPQLLLGQKEYSIAMDMWSLGCIMAELLSKKTSFKWKSRSRSIRQDIQYAWHSK